MADTDSGSDVHAFDTDNRPMVMPGPCDGQCPDPAEIVVIKTNKVYDFVFLHENREECIGVQGRRCPEPVSVIGTVDRERTGCREVGQRVVLPNSGGLYQVTLLTQIFATVTVTDRMGAHCPVDLVLPITRTVNLCAPPGTRIDCELTPACTCVLNNGAAVPGEPSCQVCCTFHNLLVVTSVATVHLLVPSYGSVMPASSDAPERLVPTPP